jgi:hypothetical protein
LTVLPLAPALCKLILSLLRKRQNNLLITITTDVENA